MEIQGAAKVTTFVAMYMAFSSTMLITNKGAVMFFPFPSILLFLQMLVSAILIWVLGQGGYLKVDRLDMEKVKAYIGVVIVSFISLILFCFFAHNRFLFSISLQI